MSDEELVSSFPELGSGDSGFSLGTPVCRTLASLSMTEVDVDDDISPEEITLQL